MRRQNKRDRCTHIVLRVLEQLPQIPLDGWQRCVDKLRCDVGDAGKVVSLQVVHLPQEAVDRSALQWVGLAHVVRVSLYKHELF